MRLASARLKLCGGVAILTIGWVLLHIGTRYNACIATLRADNAKLDRLDAEMGVQLRGLAMLLAKGPLQPGGHEIEHILDAGDYSDEGFVTLGDWIDPSIRVPFWSDDNKPVPVGLSGETLFRLKLTEFSHIWLQAQIIAEHLTMRNDPDTRLAQAHQAILLRQIQWLIAAGEAKQAISAEHCVGRSLGVD